MNCRKEIQREAEIGLRGASSLRPVKKGYSPDFDPGSGEDLFDADKASRV
jgi:hypothetical protein